MSGDVYVIEADARSAVGNLRVGFTHSGVGGRLELEAPATGPNTRRAQYWRITQVFTANAQLRNVYSDKCATVARPEHSPVYLQYCGGLGSVRGQIWSVGFYGHIRDGLATLPSENHAPRSLASMCLDITNFRNVVGTRMQVGRCHGKWNQQFQLRKVAPADL